MPWSLGQVIRDWQNDRWSKQQCLQQPPPVTVFYCLVYQSQPPILESSASVQSMISLRRATKIFRIRKPLTICICISLLPPFLCRMLRQLIIRMACDSKLPHCVEESRQLFNKWMADPHMKQLVMNNNSNKNCFLCVQCIIFWNDILPWELDHKTDQSPCSVYSAA